MNKYEEQKNVIVGAGFHPCPEKGITIITLVITIVLMLILASISINVVINGGLFGYASDAKKNTEIANEKETLAQASIYAVSKDKRGNLNQANLQNEIDKLLGEGKTTVYNTGNGFEVLFQDTGLYYEVDKKGNVGDYKTGTKDESPANIFLDENGNTLNGTTTPYQINSIEDLVMLANVANGAGNYIDAEGNIVDAVYNNFSGKIIELTKTLNFNSPTSYADLNIMWSYDAEADAYIIDEESTTNLMEIITDRNGVGFVPINLKASNVNTYFLGTFNGNYHEIQNIYENRTDKAGLFGDIRSATIKNLGITGNIITEGNAGSICVIPASGTKFFNCYSLVDITGSSAGGLAFRAKNVTMINCYNSGDIICSGKAGGLYGSDDTNSTTNIINCYNFGYLEVLGTTAYDSAGGIIGNVYGTGTRNIINSCSLRNNY